MSPLRCATGSLPLLALLLLVAVPAAAKSKTAAAVEAANAAKASFHARNASGHRAPEGMGAPNRTMKVVVAQVHDDGTLAIENPRGQRLGTIDPRAIPELIAQDKARFDGRKHLQPSDLAVGQRLKLTLRGNTSEILKAKVLKDRSS